jgi:hypothetical protein
MCYECVMYVLCMCYVCVMCVLCMCYECVMYVLCMCYVCVMYVLCMCYVCDMYVLCMLCLLHCGRALSLSIIPGRYISVVVLSDGSSVSQVYQVLDIDLSKSYSIEGVFSWSVRLYNPHQG